MRCKTCDYSLQGLAEHRCPECGRGFDPNDPATFIDENAPVISQPVSDWIANLFSLGVIIILTVICIVVVVSCSRSGIAGRAGEVLELRQADFAAPFR